MKTYKIIIREKEENWFFEGPAGLFSIPKELLPLHRQMLTNLLQKCGFVVEWGEE